MVTPLSHRPRPRAPTLNSDFFLRRFSLRVTKTSVSDVDHCRQLPTPRRELDYKSQCHLTGQPRKHHRLHRGQQQQPLWHELCFYGMFFLTAGI
jgi:hypothetical protein